MHCADSNDEAKDDLTQTGGGQPAVGLAFRNRAVEGAVANSGFYGRDLDEQRGRLQTRGEIASRIEKGQVLVGTPETILKQIRRLQDELGVGVLDLALGAQLGDKTMKSIELFGEKVIPRMHELWPHRISKTVLSKRRSRPMDFPFGTSKRETDHL
jgi:alkanesulfonate monooxygenase SsuD/methylene tetrahydromethanopterin reductase-like flavin-dependent oxidoreductase (luciferase family)